MPIDKRRVAAELDSSVETIETYLADNTGITERYQEAFQRLPKEWTAEHIRSELRETSYPGAYPIGEFDSANSIVTRHHPSDEWDNHEEVNNWARQILRNVPAMAVDGSQLQPTSQFNVPLAYVQAAWAINYHHPDGRLERDIEGRLLTPDEVTQQSENGDYRFVDSQLSGITASSTREHYSSNNSPSWRSLAMMVTLSANQSCSMMVHWSRHLPTR